MAFSNRLTPAQAERLALLVEEMGEAMQAVGKILRHGYESRHPSGGPSNQEILEAELGDVQAAYSLLVAADDIDSNFVSECVEEKLEKVGRYLHHQPLKIIYAAKALSAEAPTGET